MKKLTTIILPALFITLFALTAYADEIRLITDASYDAALPFSEGLAAVQRGMRSATSWGFIDTEGNEVISTYPRRFKAAGSFSEGLAPMRRWADDKSGFIDGAGNTAIDFRWDFARGFSEGLAAVGNLLPGNEEFFHGVLIPPDHDSGLRRADMVNTNWGFIDKQGELVIPMEFAVVYNFHDGLARVARLVGDTLQWKYIDIYGNTVSTFEYDFFASPLDDYGLELVRREGRLGIIDTEGNVVIPFEFEELWYIGEGRLRFRTEPWGDSFTGMGIMDMEGNVIVPPIFWNINSFNEEGLAVVSGSLAAGAGMAIIDRYGNYVVPFDRFAIITNVSEGFATVSLIGQGGGDFGYREFIAFPPRDVEED